MSGPMPVQLTDAAIERMLLERAGDGAPDAFVRDIVATADVTAQLPRPVIRWLPALEGPRLLAAAALLLLAAAAGALLLSGAIRLAVQPPLPTVAPSAAPPSLAASPPSSAAPTGEASASPGASGSPQAAASGRPIIVEQQHGATATILSIDPVSGEQTELGTVAGHGPSGEHIVLSADGSTAFIYADTDSLQATLDLGTGILAPAGFAPSPSRDSVSPRGDRVAQLDDANDVRLLDLDGFEVATIDLPRGIQPLLGLGWLPDQSAVLVAACDVCPKTGRSHWHLYVAPVDGGDVRVLGDEPGAFPPEAVSPDGTTLAFSDQACNDTGTRCTGGIRLMRLSDGSVTRVEGADGDRPAWSPDGRRIAYQGPTGDPGIRVIGVDGSNPTRLTDGPDDDARWSATGDELLFTRAGQDVYPGDVWIVPTSGGPPRLVIRDAVADW